MLPLLVDRGHFTIFSFSSRFSLPTGYLSVYLFLLRRSGDILRTWGGGDGRIEPLYIMVLNYYRTDSNLLPCVPV